MPSRCAEDAQSRIAKAAMRLVAERGARDVALAGVRLATGTTPAAIAGHCATAEDLWDLKRNLLNAAWKRRGVLLHRASSRRPNALRASAAGIAATHETKES